MCSWHHSWHLNKYELSDCLPPWTLCWAGEKDIWSRGLRPFSSTSSQRLLVESNMVRAHGTSIHVLPVTHVCWPTEFCTLRLTQGTALQHLTISIMPIFSIQPTLHKVGDPTSHYCSCIFGQPWPMGWSMAPLQDLQFLCLEHQVTEAASDCWLTEYKANWNHSPSFTRSTARWWVIFPPYTQYLGPVCFKPKCIPVIFYFSVKLYGLFLVAEIFSYS